jgi:hypothetical protein
MTSQNGMGANWKNGTIEQTIAYRLTLDAITSQAHFPASQCRFTVPRAVC